MIYSKYIKRILGFLFAFILLIILSPILLLLAALVRIKLGSPIFFVQERVGYKEKVFHLIKFRTMTNAKDEKGILLPNEQRFTKFGGMLRKLSLDELPELFNILKGDMSFVGPRPLLTYYLDYYNEEQHKRHNVRPGFTCIASVKGRNSMPWVDSLALDTYYAEHVSFWLDLEIFFKTIGVVLLRKGSPDALNSGRVPLMEALKAQKKSKQ